MRKSKTRKKPQAPTPRVAPKAPAFRDAQEEFELAAAVVLTSIEQLAEASARYADTANLAEHEVLHYLHADASELRSALQETKVVERILTSHAPVSPRTPIGGRWVDPLSPSQLIELAEAASESDEPYLVQLDTNQREDLQRRERLQATADAPCGRNGGCGVRRVYLPGDTPGPACWRHLTADEGSSVENLYDMAVAKYTCAGCGAAPEEACELEVTSRLNMVDGKWPLTRSFRGRKVHKNRLDAVPIPGADLVNERD